MSSKICGISRRHFRRLVMKESQSIAGDNFGQRDDSNNDNLRDNISNDNQPLLEPLISDSNLCEDDVLNFEGEKYDLKENLRDWCVRYRIPRAACDDLLSILLSAGLDVPKTSKTLSEAKSNQINTLEITSGQYVHFGIEKSLQLLNLTLPDESEEIEIDIGIGGLPLFKSSGTTLYKMHHNQFFWENSNVLEKIDIKMVSQFPLDVMHLIDLGVGKNIILNIWRGKHSQRKLSETEKNDLDRALMTMKSYIPREFARKPRSMTELKRWKAIEFRQVLLYTGIVLFKDILTEDLYVHYLLLHSSYRLISCPKNCQKNLSCVEEMLKTFVHNFKFIYGEHKITYNVHNLLHLAECVKIYGNVDSFSAYKFENFLQSFKKDCRQPTKILEQLYNRTVEKSRIKDKVAKIGLGRLCNKQLKTSASPLYRNYYCDQFYLSSRSPDNYCYINPLIPLKILGFSKNYNGEEVLIGLTFSRIDSFFTETVDSKEALGICFVQELCNEQQEFKIKDILCKVMCLPFKDGFVFIPILHQCTY